MRTQILTLICLAGLALPVSIMAMGDEYPEHNENVVIADKTILASGTIKSIASDRMSLRIFHNPIAALGWPAMNMPFEVADHELVSSLHAGDKVNFEFVQKEGKNVIVKISR